MPILSQQIAVAPLFVIAIIAVVFTLFLLSVAMFWFLGRHWIRAYLAAAPISIFSLAGMALRRTNISEVVQHGIAAKHAGYPIDWNDLETAAIEGVDLETIVKAYCVSRENGHDYSLAELVSAARESRLSKLIEK